MLLEMLVAIALLTAFALIASRLFTWSMRITAEAPAAEQQILLFESWLDDVRRDVWSAVQVRATDEFNLAADEVRWTIRDDGSVERSAGGETRAWDGVGARVRFEADESGVIVRVLDRRGAPSHRIFLPSEITLLRRAAP
jgi:type II secretory pathway pseudopilin PulG